MFCTSQNSKCQDLPKFQWGGRVFCTSQKSKCQDLPKFQWGGGGGGVFCTSEKSKCKDLPKCQFLGGDEGRESGVFCTRQKSKCQDLPKFQFSGGCPVPNPRSGCSCQFEHKFCLATFLEAFASQIVSRILRMWRLINVYKYVNQKRLGCHAGHQEVTRCRTKGESEDSIALIDPPWL